MSYSVSVGDQDIGNITWNVMGMFVFAFTRKPYRRECDGIARTKRRIEIADNKITRFRELDGCVASDVLPMLEQAFIHMSAKENKEEYEVMNPKNGWGNHMLTLQFLGRLVDACRLCPTERIDVR